jgi:hypothetical protein
MRPLVLDRRNLLFAGTVMLAGVFGLGQGCASITNTTAVQCTSEAECIGLGPEFAGSTCDPATKTCVKPSNDVGLCAHNQECLDRFNGAPAICRKSDKKCVALTTPECPTVLTKQGNVELANDNAIVIGAMTPAGTVELGTVMEDAIGLAQAEISNDFLKGLPPVPGSSDSRPLVVVACREFTGGTEGLLRAANHLAKNVQVPLVIGPVDPSNGGIAASQVFLPNRIVDVLATSVISGLANLPNPIAPTPLIWRLNFDDRSVATVVSQFVTNQLEPLVIAKGTAAPIKIALVAEGNQLGLSSAGQMTKALRFNGKTAAENAADGNFISVNFGDLNDPLGNPNPEGKISQTLATLVQFKPNIILHSYAVFGIQRILFGVEQAWPAGVTRPYHVGLTPPWNIFAPMFSFLDAQPFRSGRVFAAQNFTSATEPPFPVASAPVQAWLSRLNDKYPDLAISQTPKNQLVWLLYDATYLAAYAIAALKDKPITGENLAQTLSLFNPPGTTITTYESGDLSKGFAELGAGRGIDLQGLSGNMNFDLGFAAPTYGLEITCPNVVNGKVANMKGSGFHFKNDTQQAVVTLADGTNNAPTSPLNGCPPPPP